MSRIATKEEQAAIHVIVKQYQQSKVRAEKVCRQPQVKIVANNSYSIWNLGHCPKYTLKERKQMYLRTVRANLVAEFINKFGVDPDLPWSKL
jgi:hypothetical protein